MEMFFDLKTKTVSKGTILLHQGERCNTGYKVLKGCLKSYVIDKTGKEHLLQFAPEGWFISDMEGFMTGKPSAIFIDAIEDSEVMLLTKSALGELEEQDQPILVEQNKKLLRNLISANKRLIALLSSTAEERYTDFIDTYPSLMKRLPLKLIASYLGMTPEYLSDVRRKLAKK